jgi:hypothetical protein
MGTLDPIFIREHRHGPCVFGPGDRDWYVDHRLHGADPHEFAAELHELFTGEPDFVRVEIIRQREPQEDSSELFAGAGGIVGLLRRKASREMRIHIADAAQGDPSSRRAYAEHAAVRHAIDGNAKLPADDEEDQI